MQGKMKVTVMHSIGKMGFVERDIPKTADNEVLVKLEYVGICDSDLHYYESGIINAKDQDAVKAVLKLTCGAGCDLAIEIAGTEVTTQQTIYMTNKGSNIVLVGYGKSGMMNLPLSLALDNELTFKTVFRYRHIYPLAIDAVASGKVNLKGIVTNVSEFDDVQNAMDYSIRNKENIVKAVVKIVK